MMTRVQGFDVHRWIIFHLALILLTKANAQSLSPSPHDLQSSQASSRTTVFAVLITVFFLVGLFSIYVRHCKRPASDDSRRYNRHRGYDGFTRRGGLEDAIVESFPVFTFSSVKESKIGSGELECAICLNEFEDRETVRLLPSCSHLFHIDCIDAWLFSHTTCPVCRYNLTANSETRVPLRDHVVIDITRDLEGAKNHNGRLRYETTGKFRRSNSTGHSMDRLGDDTEKYTLRVPDDVKRQIMEATGRRLKRTRSFDAMLMAEGRGKCYWCGEPSSDEDQVRSGLNSNPSSVRSNGVKLK